eukprot:TRINITY_DN9854_c2_g1_i2.p2 TRINITY_DN9854_c2_g1~~TRINITY_DN9854_c2_g1_i2.p2  ORF type:complete len:135 (-),score=0.10 TRINITY_DN9854_c2_g1_i2:469-873(-)
MSSNCAIPQQGIQIMLFLINVEQLVQVVQTQFDDKQLKNNIFLFFLIQMSSKIHNYNYKGAHICENFVYKNIDLSRANLRGGVTCPRLHGNSLPQEWGWGRRGSKKNVLVSFKSHRTETNQIQSRKLYFLNFIP